jgi:hypothetical protein
VAAARGRLSIRGRRRRAGEAAVASGRRVGRRRGGRRVPRVARARDARLRPPAPAVPVPVRARRRRLPGLVGRHLLIIRPPELRRRGRLILLRTTPTRGINDDGVGTTAVVEGAVDGVQERRREGAAGRLPSALHAARPARRRERGRVRVRVLAAVAMAAPLHVVRESCADRTTSSKRRRRTFGSDI